MRKSPFFLFTILALCFVLTCLTGAASVLVIALGAADTGGAVAFSYYEGLNFGLLSIAMPLIGMLLLALSAPALLRRGETTEVTASPTGAESAALEVTTLLEPAAV